MSGPDPSTPEPAAGAPEPRGGRMAKPQPKPRHGARPPEPESTIGSGSATGFVSMLAKRQFDPDSLAATPGDEAARRDRLQMAREVPTPPPPPNPVSLWSRLAFPVALLLAVVLLGIGAWAIGALVYMHNVTPISPRDVHYPLLSWRFNAGPLGGYTAASRFMAWTMLLCIPVAIMLVVIGFLLRQRTRSR